MFIQFGYVVLFSSAFPLAAMCALINNIIEIRSDALKLCTGLQRPFGQRVESIGQWQVRGGLLTVPLCCRPVLNRSFTCIAFKSFKSTEKESPYLAVNIIAYKLLNIKLLVRD